ncbi:MAG: DUF4846 domain-containing protein [Bacteroidetes bacterium]|nr:DUF4846 domain-containing protein [Bacteroidota bacterium]
MKLVGWMLLLFLSCWQIDTAKTDSDDLPNTNFNRNNEEITSQSIVDESGMTIKTRFNPPDGFERVKTPEGSFSFYLQNLPLHSAGTKVKYYDGGTKNAEHVYAAVVNMDIGKRDLQQCADAIMRLRGEYLFKKEAYDDIHFNFTNGFRVDYQKWKEGYRIRVNGNKTNWYKAKAPSNSYQDFRKYMDIVFAYAGTWSLSKELQSVEWENLKIGDILIQGGSPGHAVIVVDMAKKETTDEKYFLLAQSYMPAQDIQILHNPENSTLSPWYSNRVGERLRTPEWIFQKGDLKRFGD